MSSPDQVKLQTAALLREHPELAEDNALLTDMLEGSTEVMEVVRVLIFQHQEDTMLIAGIKQRKADLDVRKGRLEQRVETVKATVKQLLLLLPDGQRVLRLAEATVAYRKASKHGAVLIHDLDQIPQGFYRTEKVALAKEIAESLRAGGEVPGAQLLPGKDGVSITNK